jgi:Calx-beta domain
VVRLNAPSAASVSVNYFTSNGSAVANTDYIGISTNTLTFAPGEMVKTVRVPIVDDTTAEPTESFFFNLSSPTGGAVIGNGIGRATVIDDDGPPAVAAPEVARVALNVPTPVSGISISENGVISGGAIALTLANDADVPFAAATGLSSPLNGIFTVTLEDLRGLLSVMGSGITGSNTTKLTFAKAA